MPATSAPTSAATAAARIAAVSGSRPVRTTVAPHAASARTVARPMPRVPPVIIATRPARSAIHRPVLQHREGDGEAGHVDHRVGVQLDAELLLDGGDERHVPERVPRRDPPVGEPFDVHGIAQLQCLAEDPGEPVARSHQLSDLPHVERISLTTLSLRLEPREVRWRSRVNARKATNFGGRRRPAPAPSSAAGGRRPRAARGAAPPGPAGTPPAPASAPPGSRGA